VRFDGYRHRSLRYVHSCPQERIAETIQTFPSRSVRVFQLTMFRWKNRLGGSTRESIRLASADDTADRIHTEATGIFREALPGGHRSLTEGVRIEQFGDCLEERLDVLSLAGGSGEDVGWDGHADWTPRRAFGFSCLASRSFVTHLYRSRAPATSSSDIVVSRYLRRSSVAAFCSGSVPQVTT